MRIYRKNPNKTAQEIADLITAKEFEISLTKGKRKIVEPISMEAFKWLQYNSHTIYPIVEGLIQKYKVAMYVDYCCKNDCYLNVIWQEK